MFRGGRQAVVHFTAIALIALVACILPGQKVHATAGINQELSFEGKIVSSTGTNITDGNYNTEFVIYTGCTNEPTSNAGCTAAWTEDYLTSNTTYASTVPVAFTSGTFQVNLGAICSFSGGSCEGNTNTAINWDTYPLYVSINVGTTSACATSFSSCGGGTGAMNPYILLTSSPYALNAANADSLGGVAASSYAQLASSNTWSSANHIQTTAANALQVTNSSNIAILTADTSASQVLLGQTGATGANGQLIFNSATAGNYAVTLNTSSSLVASYALTLPTSAPSTSQCLQTDAITASQLDFGTCATLQSAYNGGSTISTTAGGTLGINAGAVPTANMVNISNSGQGVSTNNVNDLGVNFVGGAGSSGSEAAGMRIDYTPGSASGSVWDGLHIVNDTGSSSGVTSYGIKLDGNTGGTGNDEGVFVGTGWDIGMDIQSGGLQLASQSAPAVPAANELRVYAESMAGRMMLRVEGPAGLSYSLQPSIFANKIGWWTSQGNGTTVSTINFNNSAAGTATSRTVATTSFFTQMRRIGYVSSATAGSAAGTRNNAAQYWLGNASGLGGFYYVTRFGLSQVQSNMISFAGLSATTGVLSATTNPSSDLNMLGFACDSSDSQFTFMHNNGSGTATKEALSGTFPCNTANTDVYDARIFAAPNASEVCYELQRISSTDDASGCVTTKLPSNTTLMSPQMFVSNNSTAAAVAIDVISQYIETDN